MSNLWKNASIEIARRQSLLEKTEYSEFRELIDLSPNDLLTFQQVKKWRQRKFPRPKGRPEFGYESHQKFYNRYTLEFQKLIDPRNSLDRIPIKNDKGESNNDEKERRKD